MINATGEPVETGVGNPITYPINLHRYDQSNNAIKTEIYVVLNVAVKKTKTKLITREVHCHVLEGAEH